MNLEMSENINEIAEAISNFQSELANVHEGKQGHKYNYADLAAIYNAIRPLLAKNGLAHIQPISSSSDNIVTVENILMHKSGQYIKSSMTVTVTHTNKSMNEWQSIGTAITYLRRYSIASMLGIATADDDAASAPAIEKVANKVNSRDPKDFIKQRVTDIEQMRSTVEPVEKTELIKDLYRLINIYKVEHADVNKWLAHADVASLEELNAQQLSKCINYINEKLS